MQKIKIGSEWQSIDGKVVTLDTQKKENSYHDAIEKTLEELKYFQKHNDKISYGADDLSQKLAEMYLELFEKAGRLVSVLDTQKKENSYQPDTKIDTKEEYVEPVSIRKKTWRKVYLLNRCDHDYVLKNQGYTSCDYLMREYECSICGKSKKKFYNFMSI